MLEFTVKQLEVFAAAANTGSFTAAAQELFLSQSTVSAHIQALEKALGATLFVRSARRRVELTEEGRAVLASAEDILARCRALSETFAPADGAALVLCASTVPAKCLLPGLMAGFLARQPDCRCTLRRADTAGVHRMLAERAASVGFVGAAPDDENFVYYPVADDKLVLLAPDTARFRALRDRGALGRELLAEPMIVRENGSGTRERFNTYLESIGFDPRSLRVAAQIDDPDAILSAVASGIGTAVYSALASEDAVKSGRVLAFELDGRSFYRKLYLVTRRDAALTRMEQAFISFVLGH